MMDLEISQIFIQIIAFLLMLWVLKRYGWKPLLDLLHERQNKIQSEFDSIAAQKEGIQRLIEEYNQKLSDIEGEARHKIQEAIIQGQKIAVEIQEEAQVHAKAMIGKVKEDVNKEIAKARNHFRNDVVNLAIVIAEKILQEKLDQSEHQRLIAEFVKETELK